MNSDWWEEEIKELIVEERIFTITMWIVIAFASVFIPATLICWPMT